MNARTRWAWAVAAARSGLPGVLFDGDLRAGREGWMFTAPWFAPLEAANDPHAFPGPSAA